MTLDDLMQDLSKRLGLRVVALSTRDGQPVTELVDLYQPSPAGFGGNLVVSGGDIYSWDLWLEDELNWNFQSLRLGQSS